MALQGKFLQFCNVFNNFRCITFNNWYNYPSIQQIAGLRQSVEEKFNLPVKPKRPLTPFFKFMVKIRPEVKKANPNANMIDIAREISHRWEKVDFKTKNELESEYKKEHAVYAKIRLDYESKLTPAQKELIKEDKIRRTEIKEKRKLKQKCKANNRPRKPCSTFVLYMKGQLPHRGDRDFKTFQKDVAEGWKNMTDAQRKPFVEKAEALMKEYQKEMVEWERNMIKMGNTDIVRQDALIDLKPKSKGAHAHKKATE